MKHSEYTARVLTADSGKYLTQAEEVDIFDRAIVTEAWLAPADSPDRWREIDAAEAEAYREQHRAALTAMRHQPAPPITAEEGDTYTDVEG